MREWESSISTSVHSVRSGFVAGLGSLSMSEGDVRLVGKYKGSSRPLLEVGVVIAQGEEYIRSLRGCTKVEALVW